MGRLLCGADLGDGVTCRVPAVFDHKHRDERRPVHHHELWQIEQVSDGCAYCRACGDEFDRPSEEPGFPFPDMSGLIAAEAQRAETEELLNQADRMVPAKGLVEVLTGLPLPSFTEMKAKYDVPVPGVVDVADTQRPLPEWSTEYKLRHVLGRPSLARRLCAHLEPQEAAELAEVLDGLFERSMAAVQRAVDEVTEETLARMHEDAQIKLREVRRERFTGHSRLG